MHFQIRRCVDRRCRFRGRSQKEYAFATRLRIHPGIRQTPRVLETRDDRSQYGPAPKVADEPKAQPEKIQPPSESAFACPPPASARTERMRKTGPAVQSLRQGSLGTPFRRPVEQPRRSPALSTMPKPTQVTSPVACRVTEFNIRTENDQDDCVPAPGRSWLRDPWR